MSRDLRVEAMAISGWGGFMAFLQRNDVQHGVRGDDQGFARWLTTPRRA